MRYEEFRHAFDDALRESKLGLIRRSGDETLDLRSLARTYEIHVEPLGGQDAEPFFVAATLSFRWDALSSLNVESRGARNVTRHESLRSHA